MGPEAVRPAPWDMGAAPGSPEVVRPLSWDPGVRERTRPGTESRPAPWDAERDSAGARPWYAELERPLPPGTRPRASPPPVRPASTTRVLPPVDDTGPAPVLPVSSREDRASDDGASPPASRVLYLPPREVPAPRWPAKPPTFPNPRVQVLSIEGEPVSIREPRSHHAPAASNEHRKADAGSLLVREPVAEPAPVEVPRSHPWPELPPAQVHSSDDLPWPELPPPPTGEPMGVLVELREWERLRRLEREQRGE